MNILMSESGHSFLKASAALLCSCAHPAGPGERCGYPATPLSDPLSLLPLSSSCSGFLLPSLLWLHPFLSHIITIATTYWIFPMSQACVMHFSCSISSRHKVLSSSPLWLSGASRGSPKSSRPPACWDLTPALPDFKAGALNCYDTAPWLPLIFES